MHRVLKPTGSIFLHCDWHADAYIRVEILDKIFGRNNFRNEIVWCYVGPGSPGVKQFLKKHDTIFWYVKSNIWTFNLDQVRLPHSEKTKDNFKSGLAGSGFEGAPREINEKGKVPEDWWTNIAIAARYPKGSPNNIGYPTQKPMALLERIIKCASNEGELVLDPFMGGGTTIAVADKLNRKWIGIDQSVQAVKVTELRLHQQTDLFTNIYANSYTLQLHKYDYDTLRNKDAFEFESWIIGQFGGAPRNKKGGDAGIDGTASDGAPIQVKRSESIGVNVVKNFSVSAKQFDKTVFEKNVKAGKPVGYIIAFSFGRGAVQEVARLKNQENVIIQLVPVDTIIPVSKRPNIKIEVTELSRDASGIRELEFTATGESPSGIEFYSWDFDYDAGKGIKSSVIRDTDGKQQRPMTAGVYYIAFKALDNEGLENVETIKLKINAVIEQIK
jgi:hypothetical protein